jgi:DNA-binding transcriptional ArsR family regulator
VARQKRQKASRAGRGSGVPQGPGASNGRCRPPSDDDLIAALNHSLRREVLRRLHRAEKSLSPADLSRLVGIKVTNLSYHVTVLRQYRVVKMVDKRPVRGAIEHFYESKVADNPLALEILKKTRAKDEGKA